MAPSHLSEAGTSLPWAPTGAVFHQMLRRRMRKKGLVQRVWAVTTPPVFAPLDGGGGPPVNSDVPPRVTELTDDDEGQSHTQLLGEFPFGAAERCLAAAAPLRVLAGGPDQRDRTQGAHGLWELACAPPSARPPIRCDHRCPPQPTLLPVSLFFPKSQLSDRAHNQHLRIATVDIRYRPLGKRCIPICVMPCVMNDYAGGWDDNTAHAPNCKALLSQPETLVALQAIVMPASLTDATTLRADTLPTVDAAAGALWNMAAASEPTREALLAHDSLFEALVFLLQRMASARLGPDDRDWRLRSTRVQLATGALCSLLTNISGVQRMFKHKLEDLAPKKPPVRPKRVSR